MGKVTNWDTPTEKTTDFASNKQVPGFFNLVNDGDEAVVRFMYSSVDEFEVYTVHPLEVTTSTGKKWYPKVYCLREDSNQPTGDCPFCQMGEKIQDRFYIKLIHYVKDESGHIVPQEKIWDRGVAYARKLKNLINEYGPLTDCIFKVRRSGERGSQDTTYDIMYGSPNIYTPELYPKMPNAFKDYHVLGDTVLMKSAEDMLYFIQTGQFPYNKPEVENKVETSYPTMDNIGDTPFTNSSMAYSSAPAYQNPTPQNISVPWDTPNSAPVQPQPTQTSNPMPWDNAPQNVQRPVRTY